MTCIASDCSISGPWMDANLGTCRDAIDADQHACSCVHTYMYAWIVDLHGFLGEQVTPKLLQCMIAYVYEKPMLAGTKAAAASNLEHQIHRAHSIPVIP